MGWVGTKLSFLCLFLVVGYGLYHTTFAHISGAYGKVKDVFFLLFSHYFMIT